MSRKNSLCCASPFREGFSIEEVHEHSKIDPWFLEQIKEIIDIEDSIKASGAPYSLNELQFIKSKGFSDNRIAELLNLKLRE